MSLSVELGLLLALATAFASVVGFLYKQRGAVESPPPWSCDGRSGRPLALFRSRWYVLGISIAMGSWGLHVAALSLAPISLVQSVIAGGLVLLTVVATGFFDHGSPGGSGSASAWRRGPGVPVGDDRRRPATTPTPPTTRAAVALGGRAVGGAALVVAALGPRRAHEGVILGGLGRTVLGGLGHLDQGAHGPSGRRAPPRVFNPLAAVIALASFAGLAVSARSLQLGKAVP